MRSVKNCFVSAVGAAAIVLGISLPAFADWANPNYTDLTYSLANITAETSEITVLGSLFAKNIKVVYIEDMLNDAQVTVVKNSLNNILTKANILTLQNVLNLKNVLNGNSILTFGDFLSNNNASLRDIIAIDHFNDGGIIIFCAHHH